MALRTGELAVHLVIEQANQVLRNSHTQLSKLTSSGYRASRAHHLHEAIEARHQPAPVQEWRKVLRLVSDTAAQGDSNAVMLDSAGRELLQGLTAYNYRVSIIDAFDSTRSSTCQANPSSTTAPGTPYTQPASARLELGVPPSSQAVV